MAGRPKVLSDPEVRADLLRAFRAGTSIAFACDVAGLSHEAFFAMQRRVRDGSAEPWEAQFSDECYRARSRKHLELLESIENAGADPKEWKAHAWALSKMRRSDFGADATYIATGSAGTSKTREELLAEVLAELNAMDSTVPPPSSQPKGPA